METTLVISILINIFLSGCLITLTIHEIKTTKDNIRFLSGIEELTRLIYGLSKVDMKTKEKALQQTEDKN